MTHLEIVEVRDAPGGGPAGLAWDGQLLWHADYAAGSLFALDPESGAVQDRILCPGVVSGLAWDGQSLWQALMDEGWLRNINPQTHDFDRTIVVEAHGRLSGVTWDGQQLWVASQQNGQLLAIDRERENVRRTLDIPVAVGGIAYQAGSLWLGFPDRMVYTAGEFKWAGPPDHYAVAQLDPQTGRETARYPIDFLPLGMEWVGDDLWLANATQRQLVRAQLVD
jgi:streptogramin lyase